MKKIRFTPQRISMDAMLAAMCMALASLALQLGGNFKITFESVPVIIGALLFGPADAMLIGGLGTFAYQLLFSGYGITATTPLWILPYVACGYIVGALARRAGDGLRGWRLMAAIGAAELCVTLLNTAALYVDSKLYGYYSAAFVFGTLAVRLALCAAKAVVYAEVLPVLLAALRRFRTAGTGGYRK